MNIKRFQLMWRRDYLSPLMPGASQTFGKTPASISAKGTGGVSYVVEKTLGPLAAWGGTASIPDTERQKIVRTIPMSSYSSLGELCERTPVVILAGGRGTRLLPYTTSLPKPLMPVGEFPILEILLRQLAKQGFRNITLAVGHLAGLIQAYFKDGSDWDLEISYSYETTPLGTAGPLAKMAPTAQDTLVLNGDLLTTLDFASIVSYHREHRATATIGTKRRTEKVDFGVIESAVNGAIVGFREKPSRDYLVSMGIYVFSPAVRELIPRDQRFDFPELVQLLLANGKPVMSFESDAYWMDIGRPDDYKQANEDFPAMEGEFLKTYVESAAV